MTYCYTYRPVYLLTFIRETSYCSGQLTQRPSVANIQRMWSSQPQRRHPHHTPLLRAQDLHGSEGTKVLRLTGGG